MDAQSTRRGKVLVGLGANSPGPWGSPAKTLKRALRELERRGITVEAVSNLYETAAMGAARQPPYVNQVALLATSLPAPALLRLLKQIEAQAGRRGGRPWGPRALDLDIIDYKGMTLNWSGSRKTMPRARVRPRAPAFARHCPQLAPSGVETERRGAVAAGEEAGGGECAETPLLRRSSPCFTLPGRCEPPK